MTERSPQMPSKPNFGQQAARASWVAPLVVFGLGLCTFQTRQTDRVAAIVIGAANLLIMLTGLALGIIALAGMKKWGRRGVLVPALAGFGIYICLFLLILSIVIPAMGRAKEKVRQIQDSNAEQQGREAVMEDGWFGVINYHGATVTLASMNDGNAFASSVRADLAMPVSLLVVSVDNRLGMAMDIDTKDTTISMSDGSSVSAPDTIAVLQSAKTDRAAAMKTFGPPFHIPAEAVVNGKLLFLPPGIDYRKIARISIMIDGQVQLVPGRFFTAVEKAQLVERAKAIKH